MRAVWFANRNQTATRYMCVLSVYWMVADEGFNSFVAS